jgi:hypothetical protein
MKHIVASHGPPGLCNTALHGRAMSLGRDRCAARSVASTVLREYEDFYNTYRPHSALKQAAPLRQLPDGITDLGQFRGQRRDRAGGVIHEYRLVA